MSYILDALRKAEHERLLGQPPNPVASPPPVQPTPRRFWLWLGVGLGLGFNAALLAYFLARPQPATPPTPTALASAQAQPEPIAPTATTEPPVAPPTPPAAPRKSPARKSIPPEPSLPSVVADPERRQELPPKPMLGPSVTIGPEPVPLLDTLPASARRGLPVLNLDIHAYSPDADKRFVVVNGRRYREGDSIGEGTVLETVTANGAILRQGSRRFRLSVRR